MKHYLRIWATFSVGFSWFDKLFSMHIDDMIEQDGKEAELPEAFLRGLSTAQLSGRAQIVYDNSYASSEASENSSGDLVFYLDGAHSPESMEACAKWFSSVVKGNRNSSQSSLSSMNGGENMEEVLRNMRHEKEKSKQPYKISKQVSSITNSMI